MSDICKKTLFEFAESEFETSYEEFTNTVGVIKNFISATISSIPVLSRFSGLASEAAIEGADVSDVSTCGPEMALRN